jgi:predicted ATPase/DNA-binding SARP family transcriptional activator
MTEPQTSIVSLSIQLFGPMQVRVQGSLLPAFRSHKRLWLLALLALRSNRPVEREWLSGMLWPDVDQKTALANLRPALSELRQALAAEGKRLKSPDRHTLLLDLTDAEVDVLAFDAAIKRGALSDLEQAVKLYSGLLLEGCHEEWAFAERAEREQHCLHALQALGDASLAGGEYEQACRYYQRAVGIDPFEEAARRGWMEALAKQGYINAALRVYLEFVAFLKDDPHATPDEMTHALYERLRQEARQRADLRPKARSHAIATPTEASVPKVSGYLPHPITDLIGREEERLEVGIGLRRSRLVTLTGPGGIGKTRLAWEVANEVVREYRDGVWLVALESLSDGNQVIPQIASVLGLREESGRSPLQRVTEHLRNKQLLLALDNCEHLLAASAEVAGHLLRECGQVRILATSREALGITGETVWSVPALAVPDTRQLPEGRANLMQALKSYEGVQLFVERAQAVQKSFDLTGSNARMVAQVCHQLEGIPLAIELAAARIKVLTAQQIAARLNDRLGLLTGGNRTAQPRQQTLRATLDWSYELLTQTERSLLKRLSVFAGGWTLEAAECVCGSDEGVQAFRHSGIQDNALAVPDHLNTRTLERLNTDEVLDLLTSLVDKSLVVFEAREPAEGRYRLLEMVRQYAAETLQTSGEAEQFRTRHRDWFLALAEEAEPNLKGAEQANWLQRLETEHANLRAALAFCEAEVQGALAGLRLAGALYRFWQLRADFSEGRRYLGKALERAGAQEAMAAWAKALNGAGGLAFSQGDDTSARPLFEQALTLQLELGDHAGIAFSLIGLGNVAHSQGNQEAARTLYEESLAIRRELGDLWGIANSLSNLGSVAYSLRSYGAARTLYEESLAMNRELGDKAGIANALYNLGCVAHVQGDPSQAKSLFEESLAIRQEWGDKANIANLLYNLGDVAHTQNDYAAARTLLQESLTLYREIGHPFIFHVLGLLGHAERALGDYVQATSLYQESLRLRRETGDRLSLAQSLEDFAGLAGRQGQPERALRLLGAAEALGETLGRTLPIAIAAEYERTVAAAYAALSKEAFAATWKEGRAMSIEQAVDYALEDREGGLA